MVEDLLVVTDGLSEDLERLTSHLGARPLVLLAPRSRSPTEDLPTAWRRVDAGAFFDADAFRNAFLDFVDRWPTRPCWRGRTFDEVFRRRGGYSVWWTSVGADRNPNHGIVPLAKQAWIFDRVLAALAPAKVTVLSHDPALSSLYASRCRRSRTPVEFLDGSAGPEDDPWRGRLRWVCRSLRAMVAWSLKAPVAALGAKLLAAPALRAGRPGARAIVFSWRNASYWRIRGAEVRVWFWEALCAALTGAAPELDHRFLVRSWSHVPGRRRFWGLFHSAWTSLRHLEGAVSIPTAHPSLGTWFSELPTQVRALWRYWQIERSPTFQRSFEFAGADLASLYVARLREAVASSAHWAQSVSSVAASIRSAGNVAALVLAEEMYPPAMVDIAAAKQCGVPSVGVQHATIFPMHLIYTLPPGQVRGAPLPDRFAVYGEFAKDVVSCLGAYPKERVWVTGAPRHDHLVGDPPDQQEARRRLGIPRQTRCVLMPTQTAPWFADAVRAVLTALRERADCVVCLKIHPKRVAMSSDAYRDVARDLGAENVMVFDDCYDDLLAACNVLVGASSTTVLEAILLGRTTICVNFSGEPAWYPYATDGGSLTARDPREIQAALDLALDHPEEVARRLDRQRFLRRHAGPTASGRAADVFACRLAELTGTAAVVTPPSLHSEPVASWEHP